MLCSTCKTPLAEGRKNRRCPDCDREYQRKRRTADPNAKRESDCRYRETHRDELRDRGRQWRSENRGRDQQHKKKWAQANGDKMAERYRRYRQENPQKVREANRRWAQANPDKVIARANRHRARKKGCAVSAADISQVIERSGGLCALCRSFVPEGLRHVDHIIPLAKGGPHSQENLQLLCYQCNCRKQDRLPEDVKAEAWTKREVPFQPFLLNPNWR